MSFSSSIDNVDILVYGRGRDLLGLFVMSGRSEVSSGGEVTWYLHKNYVGEYVLEQYDDQYDYETMVGSVKKEVEYVEKEVVEDVSWQIIKTQASRSIAVSHVAHVTADGGLNSVPALLQTPVPTSFVSASVDGLGRGDYQEKNKGNELSNHVW